MHAQQPLPHAYSHCTHCSDNGVGAQLLIKGIAQSADAGPGGWVGLKRKLLHLDVDGSGAVDAGGGRACECMPCLQQMLRCLSTCS